MSLKKAVAQLLTHPSPLQELFREGIFVSERGRDRVQDLVETFPLFSKEDTIYKALKKEKRSPTLQEKKVLKETDRLRESLIQVNDFPSDYFLKV